MSVMINHDTVGLPRLTARGIATKTRIVEAAADLVGNGGVYATSLDDVMAASAVSKSQLYHYFDDKDDLVREVIAVQTERVLAVHRPVFSTLDSLPALRRWRNAIVEMTGAAHCRGGCPIGSLASELSDQSETARSAIADSFDAWQTLIADGLRLMAQRGEFTPHIAHEDLATAMLSAIQGGLLMAKATHTTRPLEIALDMALEHLERHLA
jgi:AcrR family transcriptional regulator